MLNKINITSIITCFTFIVLIIIDIAIFNMKSTPLLIVEIIVLLVQMFLSGFIEGYKYKSKK